MIWLRRYPTMQHLAMHFSVPVSCIHRVIHKYVRILHSYLVPKYIRWHTMPEWHNLAGRYPEWPQVVAIVDGTPFRISKPKGLTTRLTYSQHTNDFGIVYNRLQAYFLLVSGPIQRLYYRGDCHAFFLNWKVVVDVLGYIVLSRAGFLGKASDTNCLW